MEPKEKSPSDMAIDGLEQKTRAMREDLDTIKSLISNGIIDPSDKQENAGCFDRPDLILLDYFDTQTRNISEGITFVDDKTNIVDHIIKNRNKLAEEVDKIFRPEKYMSDFIDYIENKLYDIGIIKGTNKYGDFTEEYIKETYQGLTEKIKEFNLYTEGKEIDAYNKGRMAALNILIVTDHSTLPNIEFSY